MRKREVESSVQYKASSIFKQKNKKMPRTYRFWGLVPLLAWKTRKRKTQRQLDY